MEKNDIGVYGLGVMGSNLALNLSSRGFGVSVYNKRLPEEEQLMQQFLSGPAADSGISGFNEVKEFVGSLEQPRVILLMVKAGPPVDAVIKQLLPLLDPEDIIVDGGNSHFQDTNRRLDEVSARGIRYVGMGISGGEEGARYGPSLMPGGDSAAWPRIKPFFKSMAAKADGTPCCRWLGEEGAGHFVKMVHNGIEYAIMQLLAECYHLLRSGPQMNNRQLAKTFSSWNSGPLQSYLLEITGNIFTVQEEEGAYVIDKILDQAGQKGTGRWTALTALELGVPLPLITAAVYARSLSSYKALRGQVSGGYDTSGTEKLAVEPEGLRDALLAGQIMAYAEGFWLIGAANRQYGWQISMADVAKVWREGCIIRSALLKDFSEAFEKQPDLPHLLMAPRIRALMNDTGRGWSKTIGRAIQTGVPLPGFSAALSHFQGATSDRLPANLIQAQRDYFGAHTYRRTDKPEGEAFHTDWQQKQ